MRKNQWIVAIVPAVVGLGLAWAAAPAMGNGPGCAGCGLYEAQAAPYYGLPAGYGLTPGCCESTCHPCDNAWAGYCEQKALKQARYARVGVPKSSHAGPAWQGAPRGMVVAPAASYEVFVEPTPAALPHPAVRPLPPVLTEPVEPAESPGEPLPPLPEPPTDRSAAQTDRTVRTGFSSWLWRAE